MSAVVNAFTHKTYMLKPLFTPQGAWGTSFSLHKNYKTETSLLMV